MDVLDQRATERKESDKRLPVLQITITWVMSDLRAAIADRKLLDLNCWELLLQCAAVLSDDLSGERGLSRSKGTIDGCKLETGCEPRCLSDTRPPAPSSSLCVAWLHQDNKPKLTSSVVLSVCLLFHLYIKKRTLLVFLRPFHQRGPASRCFLLWWFSFEAHQSSCLQRPGHRMMFV